ncbi:hypothetical protein PAXRUDRAFT_834286 [Paxillus rubicundulus Ve08.2h10]|uniref:Uncharacterized protein n=1 Tax=Paxillus rubicundulus Ve08.2h10 TaxID=930991 RepID=A0A0D0C7Z5_9AGAM|nr:hypothetical protein PAXRUDRAFT_834286 [Paxillus rubicundulus Ve08.2h10]
MHARRRTNTPVEFEGPFVVGNPTCLALSITVGLPSRRFCKRTDKSPDKPLVSLPAS